MQYEFTNEPISKRRISKEIKLSPWEKQRREMKQAERELLQMEFSVEELQAQGFYDSPDLIFRPYGVEIVQHNKTVHRFHKGWVDENIVTLSLSLPTKERSSLVEKRFSRYWEQSKTYHYDFRQHHSGIILWCCFDFLDWILDLPYWQELPFVPLYWQVGNEKARAAATYYINKINNGEWKEDWKIQKISDVEQKAFANYKYMTEDYEPEESYQKWMLLPFIRHCYTPYDYFWETSKMSQAKAKEVCEKRIFEVYPTVNGVEI